MKKILIIALMLTVSAFANVESKTEKWFISAGLVNMKISNSEFNELGTNVGLQYFTKGLKEEGIGFGYNNSFASKDGNYQGYDYTAKETVITGEILYNIRVDGVSIVPALIKGRLSEEVSALGITIRNNVNVRGVGVYVYLPSVAKKGHGLSLFAKRLEIENEYNQDITLAGVQFTW